MKSSRNLSFLVCLGLGVLNSAYSQAVSGTSLSITGGGTSTLTGPLNVVGGIDSDSNTFTFGTQGTSFGGALMYQDNSTDTFTFFTNRNPASWLWQHSVAIPAMRLDSAHQLILYKADGATAGITLNPTAGSLKLGSHASGTLTADANGAITAGGAFTASAGFINTSGSFTSPTGLSLSAGGTNQNIVLTPTGSGTIRIPYPATPSIFSTLSTNSAGTFILSAPSNLALQANGATRLYVYGSSGRIGIGTGTTTPARRFVVEDDPGLDGEKFIASFTRNSTSNGVFLGYRANTTAVTAAVVRAGNSLPLTLGTSTTPEAFTILNSGNVGIGTTSPTEKLQVAGSIRQVVAGRIDNELTDMSAAADAKIWAWSLNGALGGNSFGLHTRNDAGVFGQAALQFTRSGSAITTANFPNGNVGIGTATPATKLDVAGNGTTPSILTIRSRQANTYFAMVAGSSDDASGELAFERTGVSAGNTYIGGGAAGNIVFRSGGYAHKMLINSDGNVGIGTSSPQQLLHLSGADPQFLIRSTGVGLRGLWTKVDNNLGAIVFDSSFNTTGPYPMSFQIAGVESLRVAASGNIGIGTATPAAKLTVGGTHGDTQLRLFSDHYAQGIDSAYTALLNLWASEPGSTWTGTGVGNNFTNTPSLGRVSTTRGASFIRLLDNQISLNTVNAAGTHGLGLNLVGLNVGIGTTAPTHPLSVKGTIRAQEIIVDNTNWADYVFEEDYRLAPLAEVESHIKAKGHLPGIPSAAEVAQHGLSMGDMQAKLLSKVEELTLHLIAQEKELSTLRREVAALKSSAQP